MTPAKPLRLALAAPILALAAQAAPAAAETARCEFSTVCLQAQGCIPADHRVTAEWQGEDGRMDDNGRKAEVSVADMEAFIHLIDILDRGDLVILTIGRDGGAVLAKHTTQGGATIGAQFHGTCRIED